MLNARIGPPSSSPNATPPLSGTTADVVARLVGHHQRVAREAQARGRLAVRRERGSVDGLQAAVRLDPEDRDRVGALVHGEEQRAIAVDDDLVVPVDDTGLCELGGAGAARRALGDLL